MEPFSDESDFESVDLGAIKPYQYEPMYKESSDDECSNSSSDESGSDAETLSMEDVNTDDWCQCSQCIHMPTPVERRCCKTANVISEKAEGLKCITDHDGFKANCLNIHVLETCYYDHVLAHGVMEENQQIHELYRYLAYRRFTRWVYGLLPKRCRKVIPACAVTAIRSQFPSEEYCGFQYPK